MTLKEIFDKVVRWNLEADVEEILTRNDDDLPMQQLLNNIFSFD